MDLGLLDNAHDKVVGLEFLLRWSVEDLPSAARKDGVGIWQHDQDPLEAATAKLKGGGGHWLGIFQLLKQLAGQGEADKACPIREQGSVLGLVVRDLLKILQVQLEPRGAVRGAEEAKTANVLGHIAELGGVGDDATAQGFHLFSVVCSDKICLKNSNFLSLLFPERL